MDAARADTAPDFRAPSGRASRLTRSVRRASVLGLFAVALLAHSATDAAQQQQPRRAPTKGKVDMAQPVYKWVDEHGVTHYGDSIPSQYADQDTTILNEQGVPVRTIPGRRSAEQLEEEARKREAENRAKQDMVLARQRDQNLLATYLTVEEIESLRDRRLEILDSQAKVTTQYIDTLHGRLRQFEQQTQRYAPYSTEPKAGPMPEHLAEDLVRTVNEIRSQEKNLGLKRQEAQRLQEQFGRDIARFRELKKIETEYARTAQPRG
jgi:hypothetical protein